MRYEFVHKRNSDWCFEELNIIAQTLAFISTPLAGAPLVAIGKYLASIIPVKYLIIGRTDYPKGENIHTACFLNYGRQLDNITYSVKDTPCQEVFDFGICYYPVGVQAEFPNDPDLAAMNIESYMGTTLLDKYGNKIGLIVLLHDKIIENPGFLEHLLILVSPVLEYHLDLACTEVAPV